MTENEWNASLCRKKIYTVKFHLRIIFANARSLKWYQMLQELNMNWFLCSLFFAFKDVILIKDLIKNIY